MQTCEAAVCAVDSSCCSGNWDAMCGVHAGAQCADICPTGSNCCSAHGGMECDRTSCETTVCSFLGPAGPFAPCCTTEWNAFCEAAAGVFCAGLCVGVSPFLCYSIKESKGSTKFQSRTVYLHDGPEDKDYEVKKPVALCNPLHYSDPGTTIPALDTDEHLKAYTIKEAKGQPKDLKQIGIDLVVPNILLRTVVDTSKPDRLLVPSTKSIVVPISDDTHNIDHYKCYKVKTTKGTPKFIGGFFPGLDQFEPAKGYLLKKLTRVCFPVDKDGGGIINPNWNLACFSVKPDKGEPKHEKRTRIHTNNQFGTEVLDTKKEDDLCLPAELFIP